MQHPVSRSFRKKHVGRKWRNVNYRMIIGHKWNLLCFICLPFCICLKLLHAREFPKITDGTMPNNASFDRQKNLTRAWNQYQHRSSLVKVTSPRTVFWDPARATPSMPRQRGIFSCKMLQTTEKGTSAYDTKASKMFRTVCKYVQIML